MNRLLMVWTQPGMPELDAVQRFVWLIKYVSTVVIQIYRRISNIQMCPNMWVSGCLHLKWGVEPGGGFTGTWKPRTGASWTDYTLSLDQVGSNLTSVMIIYLLLLVLAGNLLMTQTNLQTNKQTKISFSDFSCHQICLFMKHEAWQSYAHK